MAISGTFVADFSSFQAAVDQSVAKLVDFSAGSDKVQASLNRMVDSFSGVKVIQQATLMTQAITDLGGATTLTANEQAKVNTVVQAGIDKYAALGQVAPQAMLDLAAATEHTSGSVLSGIPLVEGFIAAFSAERIIAFTASAVESAAQIANLSRATGVSTDALQRLAYVGQGFSLDVTDLARGVETLSDKLASGNNSATSAVAGLGLNLQQLIASGPSEAFLTIAEAVGRIEDPMTKNAIASELFGGKLAKILIPALSDLRKSLQDVPTSAIIDPDTLALADEFDTKFKQLTASTKAWTVSLLSIPVQGFLALKEILSDTTEEETQAAIGAQGFYTTASGGTTELSASTAGLAANQATARTNAEILQNKLDDLRTKSLAPLSDAQKDNIVQLQSFGVSLTEIATLVGSNTIAVKLFEDAHTAAETALKKFNTALADNNSVGTDYNDTLDKLGVVTVASIEATLKAGLSQAEAAIIYKQTADAIKSVATSMTAKTEADKKAAASLEETTKLWDDYDALVGAGSQGAYEAAGAAIDKWAADLTAKMQKAGTDTAEFYDALAADEDARYAKLNTTTLAADALSQQYYAKQMSAAADYYAFLLAQQANGVQISTASIEAARTAADSAAQAYNQWTTGITAATAASAKALRDMADAAQTSFLSVGKTVADSFTQMTTDALNASKTIAGYFGSETPQQLASLKQAAGINVNQTANIGGAGTLGLGLVGGAGSSFPSLPSFDVGGPTGAGGPALLHPGEYVIPQNGALVSSGGSTVNNFYVNGTAEETAQKIADLITKQTLRGRKISAS